MRIEGSSTDQPMLFVFGPDRPTPVGVVKAPTLAEEVEAAAREAAMLDTLETRSDPRVPGVPRPIRLEGGRVS